MTTREGHSTPNPDLLIGHGLVLQNRITELTEALQNLLTYDRVMRPAFRAMPVGAPGSQARIDQDKLIAVEDAAIAALQGVEQ